MAIINKIRNIANAIRDLTGLSDLLTLDEMADVLNSYTPLPYGISKIAYGEYAISSDYNSGCQTISHNLGAVPDLVLFWHDGNVAIASSMLASFRFYQMGYRGSKYNVFNLVHHSTSPTVVSLNNSNSGVVGVSNFTDSAFDLYTASTSYYWRAGNYKWLAVKFS